MTITLLIAWLKISAPVAFACEQYAPPTLPMCALDSIQGEEPMDSWEAIWPGLAEDDAAFAANPDVETSCDRE